MLLGRYNGQGGNGASQPDDDADHGRHRDAESRTKVGLRTIRRLGLDRPIALAFIDSVRRIREDLPSLAQQGKQMRIVKFGALRSTPVRKGIARLSSLVGWLAHRK